MVDRSRQAKGKGTRTAGPAPTDTNGSSSQKTETAERVTSFDIFELCICRARNLIKLHQAAHGRQGKPEPYASDAHRAAIVLAVSALDAFVRDFVINRTRDLLARKEQTLPTALSVQIRKFIKDEDLLEAARKDDLLERVEKAFRADFERRSFQGTRNIEEQIKVVGYNDIFHEVALAARVNEDELRTKLDGFTRRRHAIAHHGDYDLTQRPPKESVVTKKDAQECIRLACLVAKHIHRIGKR